MRGRKLTVAYFAPDLSGGGAERVMLEYVRNADRDRIQPVIILCNQAGRYQHLIPPDVPVHVLGKRSRFDLPFLLVRFRRLIRHLKPDVVVSFLWYADAIALLATPKSTKSVCSIHAVAEEIEQSRFGKLKVWLLKRLYQRADSILLLSPGNRAAFQRTFRHVSPKVLKIQPNPFDFQSIRALSDVPDQATATGVFTIVAVGRLSEVKRFDRLLEAVSRIRTDKPWILRIVGEGPLRNSLESQARALGIDKQTHFEGYVENPYPYVRRADLFVLTSRFEAYPNVIIEALALGTAVVSVDCPYGPRDILTDGAGILVPPDDVESITRAIESMIEDEQSRHDFEHKGPSVVAHMDSKIVIPALQETLVSLWNSHSDQQGA